MKLRQFVPGMLRATQGMRTGPDTCSTAPRDLLSGLQRTVEMVVYSDGSRGSLKNRKSRFFDIFKDLGAGPVGRQYRPAKKVKKNEYL